MFFFFFLTFSSFGNYLFIYFWLCWVFASVRGLPPAAASGGHSSSRCAGLSPSRPLLLRSTGSRRAGSAIVAHGPSCSAACGIFPDQGTNPCPLHWQADSQPLCHQGSPNIFILKRVEHDKHHISEFHLFHCVIRGVGIGEAFDKNHLITLGIIQTFCFSFSHSILFRYFFADG